MCFFLDTERADTLCSELVSICAKQEILPAGPTGCVRSVVYLLLEQEKSVMTEQAMAALVLGFLNVDGESA
ncbi:hypothetical protein Xvtw_16545 [Xanthomonas campestris pv. vitiswoodrowii]|nr:hypothetical protein Xvtw_16545 [Xanthomonas campestris pv. vitiswoodrowii]